MQNLILKTCDLFEVTINALTQSGRSSQRVSNARFALVYAVRQTWPHYSYAEIGGLLGGRDHSTIIHAEERAAELAQADPWFATRLAALCEVQG